MPVISLITSTVTQQFKVVPQPKRSLYSHSVTFDCESIGVPTPQISWRRKLNATLSTPIHVDLMKYMVFANHTLQINDLDYTDQGTYICVSESPRFVNESGANLTVYGKNPFILQSPYNSNIFVSMNSMIRIFKYLICTSNPLLL